MTHFSSIIFPVIIIIVVSGILAIVAATQIENILPRPPPSFDFPVTINRFWTIQSSWEQVVLYYNGDRLGANFKNMGQPRERGMARATGVFETVGTLQRNARYSYWNGTHYVERVILMPSGSPINRPNNLTLSNRGSTKDAVYNFDQIDYDNASLVFTLQTGYSGGWNGENMVQSLTSLYSNVITFEFIRKLSGGLVNIVPMTSVRVYMQMPRISTLNAEFLMLFSNGALFFTFLLISPLPLLLYQLLVEKASGTKDMMKMMGLKMGVYWFQFYLWNFMNYLLVCFAGLIIGLVYQWSFLYQSNPVTWMLVVFVFFFNLNSLLYCISCVTTNLKFGIILAYLMVLVDPIVGSAVAITLNVLTFPYDFLLRIRYLWPTHGLYEAISGGIILPCLRNECPGVLDVFRWGPLSYGIIVMISQSVLLFSIGMYEKLTNFF